MPTLHLICGLPGSGKTTLAAQLATADRTIWLSPDEWMSRIVGDGYDERRREAVEQVQWELAQRLLRAGLDVILDNGFWIRAERDSLRQQARALGAAVKLHFLEVELEELWRRLEKRNAALPPGSFAVRKRDLEQWSQGFEAPTPEEIAAE